MRAPKPNRVALLVVVAYVAANLIGAAVAAAPDQAAANKQPELSGAQVFAKNCVTCHGAHGEGGEGPDLRATLYTVEQIKQRVATGVPGEMPGFGKKLAPGEIVNVARYVHSLHTTPHR